MEEAFERAEIELVVAVEISLPILRWLSVIDYSVGAGDEITVTANSNTHTITEGIDFSAAGSNAATAQAIANAWNANSTRVGETQTRALWKGGENVAFVGLSPLITSMTLSSDDINAWDQVLPENPTTFYYCSHVGVMHEALDGDFIPAIGGVSGLEWSLDPVTRQTEVPRVDLVFSGGQEIRELLNYYTLKRIPVSLWLGAYDASAVYPDDFVELPALYIDDLIPGAGQITMKLNDAAGDSWRDRPVTGAWVGWHPLQVALDVLDKAGAVDGVHYVSASLDYETADPARSHFCISRYHDEAFNLKNSITGEGKSAGELLSELFALMSGTWRPTQSGPYEFVAFDYSASTVDSLEAGPVTGHDVDEVDQESLFGRDINDVEVAFGRGEDGKQRKFRYTDALSYQSQQSRLSTFQHRSDWLNSIAALNITSSVIGQYDPNGAGGPDNASDDRIIRDNQEEFPIAYASRQGFCGTQRTISGGGTVQAAGMSLGAAAGRYAVIRLVPSSVDQRSDNEDKVEMILISGWTLHDDLADDPGVQTSNTFSIRVSDAFAAQVCQDDPTTVLPNGATIAEFFGADPRGLWPGNPFSGRGLQDSSSTNVPDWWAGHASFLTDGVLIPQAWPLPIEDITIAFYMGREIVRRFRNGAPPIKVRTNFSFLHVDLAEFATLANDDMVISHLRGDGADTNVIWECTGKRLDLFGDTPGVEWTFTYVRDDALVEAPIVSALEPDRIVRPGEVQVGIIEDSVFYFESAGVRDGDVLTDDGGTFTVG